MKNCTRISTYHVRVQNEIGGCSNCVGGLFGGVDDKAEAAMTLFATLPRALLRQLGADQLALGSEKVAKGLWTTQIVFVNEMCEKTEVRKSGDYPYDWWSTDARR